MLVIHISPSTIVTSLCLGPLLLVRLSLSNVQTQAVRVKVYLVARVLQNLSNIPCVLKLPQINVRPALLDGVSNKFGRASLTLCANNSSLLLLTGFVDDEGGTLRFLLCDLLGLDSGGEFWGEGEVLQGVSRSSVTCQVSYARSKRHRPA
jgi:hypothetical protein